MNLKLNDQAVVKAIRDSIENARKTALPESLEHLSRAEDYLDAGRVEDARIAYTKAQAAQNYYGAKGGHAALIQRLKQHRSLCQIEAARWAPLVEHLRESTDAVAIDIRTRAQSAITHAEAGIKSADAELRLLGVE